MLIKLDSAGYFTRIAKQKKNILIWSIRWKCEIDILVKVLESGLVEFDK